MSVVPASQTPSPETIISSRGLDLTGKIVPILATLFSVIAGVVCGYSAYAAKQASTDTYIQLRSARADETRQMVVILTEKFNEAEKDNAKFRGSTEASLTAIKEALGVERDDRRSIRQPGK